MSCHNIGLGLNNVVRTTVKLMDEGKVSKSAAKKIIICCAKSVYWCDGHEYEATDYIYNCMCGNCMNVIPEGEKLYRVFEAPLSTSEKEKLWSQLVVPRLCNNCFDKVINDLLGDETVGQKCRKYIEENCNPEDHASTGEYENNNNGFRWSN